MPDFPGGNLPGVNLLRWGVTFRGQFYEGKCSGHLEKREISNTRFNYKVSCTQMNGRKLNIGAISQ